LKKYRFLFIVIALILCLCACRAQPTPGPVDPTAPVETPTGSPQVPPTPEQTPTGQPGAFTAPDGTEVLGVELSGMTREQALQALSDAAAGYRLSLTVGETQLELSGESVSLTPDAAMFDACWQALETGDELPAFSFSLDFSALEALLADALQSPAQNAAVQYSREQQKFVVAEGKAGFEHDLAAISDLVKTCMCQLYSSCRFDVPGREIAPSVTAEDPRLIAAAEAANRYLDLRLTCVFKTEQGKTSEVTIPRNELAGLVKVSSGYTVGIDRSAIDRYVSLLVLNHHTPAYNANFRATDGQIIPLTVRYTGWNPDAKALADDIYNCLTKGISGTREVPYLSDAQMYMPYEGTYIEISLTAQHLWMYENGVCVVSTPIVSGCVAIPGRLTPTGVFSIYSKSTNAWLVGPTWRDFVYYWMPFYGAYGLHDATWRSEFGGEIYVNEGSHGCTNLPLEAAAKIYEYAEIGTKVIIYGGVTKAYDLTQEITGTASYRLPLHTEPFRLDTALKYNGAPLTYTSDNPQVVSVSADGTVTLLQPGTANITVTAAPFTHHTGATFTVQVTVQDTCGEGRHTGEWVQTAEPECEKPGVETRTCIYCGQVDTRELPPVGHSFTDSSIVCTNGCGTVAPTMPELPSGPRTR